jgi:hypothetical protein
MSSAWQTSIDRTLRSTEATLESLQQRHRSYDAAKHRVDDYLGLATPYRDGKALFDSLDRADVGVPPPLPQHRRYRPAPDEGTSGDGRGLGGRQSNAFDPPHGPSPSFFNAGAYAAQNSNGRVGASGASPSRDDPTAPLQLVNAQVRGAMLELELEKAKRADSIRELAYRTTAELGELRSMIAQLQSENTSLRKSVRALEGRLGFATDSQMPSQLAGAGAASPITGASHTSFSEFGALPQPQSQQLLSRTALLASAVANSGFGLAPDKAAAASSSLLARVDALEAGLARQQQLNEDRQTRTAAVLREMVKAEVGSDMAQVRTLAREAARDSTEDLLKLRLSAMQSALQTEVQRALRVAAASETTAQQVQQQYGEVEHRFSVQLQKLSAQFVEWQRGSTSASPAASADGGGSGLVPFTAPASQERLLHLERAVEEELHGLRGQLRQLRQDTETNLERLTQEQKQMQAQLQGKASAQEVRALMDHVEEERQQRSSTSSAAGAAFREQVNSTLRPQLQLWQDALQQLQERVQEQQDGAEAWRRQANLRFAAVEASTKDLREEADRQDQQWSSCTQELRQVRAEVVAAQSRTADALRQFKAELTETCDAKLQAAEERLQTVQKDRQQQWDTQLRQLQQSVAEQQEMAQRARLTSDAAEERLRRVEATVATIESALPHSVADVKAKCEALQTVLQQTCALPLSRVQQDVEGVQRRLHAMDEDRTRMAAVWNQQLADAKRFFEEHVRNNRDMVEQRLSHQKDLYEELRGQHSSQRRCTEEQQQLMLEQMKRLQQQQQLASSPAPVLAPPAPAVAASARSASEGLSPSGGTSAPSPPPAAQVDGDKAPSPIAAVSVDALHDLQQQVQRILPQLQSMEQRVEAAERAVENAVTSTVTVADAIAPLQERLEEVRERAQRDRTEQQQQLEAMRQALCDNVQAMSEMCDRVSAAAEEQLSHARGDVASSVAPLRIATILSADPESVQHLALQLQKHLALPSSAARTLADAQTQLAQHACRLDELQQALQEAQKQVVEMRADAAAERTAAQTSATEAEAATARASLQDVADVRAELQEVLQDMKQSHTMLLTRHAALEKQTQHLSEEQLAVLAGEVDGIKQATEPLPRLIEQLKEQSTAMQAAQRQQLPTLQKYVQDVLEVVQEGQSASLDPLQLKLRTVEERHKKLQAHLEEWMVEQATATEQVRQSQQRKLEQLLAEWEAVAEAQLNPLRESVAAAQRSAAHVLERMSALETQRAAEAEEKQQLRDEVCALAARVAEEANTRDNNAGVAAPAVAAPALVSASPIKDEGAVSTGVTDAAVEHSVAQLQSFVEELDGRLTQLEEQTSDTLAVTAETLGAFSQQLHDVVTRFAAVVRSSGEDDSPSTSAAIIASDRRGAIHNLEDVFTYFLQQMQQLQHALYQLQANTVETLEILEQHEESTAALPMLQHTVDAIAAALVPLAERLGVDATSFSLQLTPLHHHGGMYPPPHDSSDSSVDSGRRDAVVS